MCWFCWVVLPVWNFLIASCVPIHRHSCILISLPSYLIAEDLLGELIQLATDPKDP